MKDGFEFTFGKKSFACSAAPAVPVLVAPCFTCATINRGSSVANNATGHFSFRLMRFPWSGFRSFYRKRPARLGDAETVARRSAFANYIRCSQSPAHSRKCSDIWAHSVTIESIAGLHPSQNITPRSGLVPGEAVGKHRDGRCSARGLRASRTLNARLRIVENGGLASQACVLATPVEFSAKSSLSRLLDSVRPPTTSRGDSWRSYFRCFPRPSRPQLRRPFLRARTGQTS